MSVPFWGWVLFVWVAIAIIGGAFEGQSISSDSQSDLNVVLNMEVFRSQEIRLLGAGFDIPIPNASYYTSLVKLASFDFALLDGDLNVVRYFMLAVLAGPIMFVFIRDVMPTLINLVATLRRLSPFG